MQVSGIAPLPHLEFDYPNGQAVRTLFTQMMLERGILATNAFYTTYAHQKEHIDEYLGAINEGFPLLAQAVHSGNVEARIAGPLAHSGFHRLT